MIAEVIVDVAAHQTDRVFEYHIPDDLEVEIGSRVVVPFGRRKVQGFVVAVKKSSDFTGQLKDLLLVVDEMPPLTPELVALSSDLARQIFAYRISILKTMLPRYIAVELFTALLENAAGEMGAKMTAMDNATRNAGEMIDRLSITYNRTRQAKITTELVEIISGAEAL